MYITPYYRNSFSPFFRQIDRLFEDAFEFDAQPAYARANVYESDDAYTIALDAPGFAKDAFDVEVDQGVVRIAAESKAAEDAGAVSRSLSRAFRLPESVDNTAISAKYENGVLNLSLPKQAKAAVQKISIG